MHKWLWSSEGIQRIKSERKDKEYNFQWQSERSRLLFDLDHEQWEEYFRTCEPDFYSKLFHTKFMGDDTKIFQIFGVPIGYAKITRKVHLQPEAPVIEYH